MRLFVSQLLLLLLTSTSTWALFSVFGNGGKAAAGLSSKKKTVVVTGATGMLGTELVKRLEASNLYIVKQLTTSPVTDASKQTQWDPSSLALDAKVLEGCDAVVHLAGENIASGSKEEFGPLAVLGWWSDKKKAKILNSRVQGTKLLVDTINTLKKRPSVFLSASAVGYYGYEDNLNSFKDDAKKGSGFLADVVDKWEAEAFKVSAENTRSACLRFAVILAKEGGVVGKVLPLFQLAAGGNFGSGEQAFSFVTINDACRAIEFGLENRKVFGRVNVCSPNPTTNEGFTQALAAAVNRPAIFPLPETAAKLIFGQFGEETILGGQRAIPVKLVNAGFVFEDADIGPALKSVLKA